MQQPHSQNIGPKDFLSSKSLGVRDVITKVDCPIGHPLGLTPSIHPLIFIDGKYGGLAPSTWPCAFRTNHSSYKSVEIRSACSISCNVPTRAGRVFKRSTNRLHNSSPITGHVGALPPPRRRCLTRGATPVCQHFAVRASVV